MKHIRALKAIRERQQAIMNDIMSKESVTNEEKNEGKDMEDGDRVHVGEVNIFYDEYRLYLFAGFLVHYLLPKWSVIIPSLKG